jgi:streptogramin lyase
VPLLELLESRRLLAGAGGNVQGVATGAGPDRNIWFTLGSNEIGMINPSNPGAGVIRYPIATPTSGPGPIAAGPEAILYASDLYKAQIYKVDKSTGTLLQTIPVSEPLDSLIFDNHNDIIYSAWVGGVGQVRRVDPTVGISSDTLLATVGVRAADLALVPGGNFVLVISQVTGMIYEVDLNHPGQTPTTFGSGQYNGGITFDSSGRLFALSNSAAGSAIVELNPTTFTVMASSGPLTGVDGLAFDPYSGNLFASSRAVDPSSGERGIYELSLQPGCFLHAPLITSSAFPPTFNPDGLEPDGEGNLYLASQGTTSDEKIYRYDITTGELVALTSALSGLDDLVPLSGLGGHSVPNYWFFEEAANKFGAIDPTTGQITETPPLLQANTQVEGITAGLGGTLWFTEFNTNQIGRIDTDTGKITEFPLHTPGAQPYGIVRGPDGNIWFTEAEANQLGRINPATGIIQEFPIDSSGSDQAESITVGPDSNLWFTLTGTNKIGVMNPTTGKMVGEYGVPTADAGLAQIVSDPADGNLWFTEAGADQVGRIDPATGAVAEFAVPTAGAAPTAIAAEKDGNLWFVESNTSKIAALSPNNPSHITEYVVPGLTPVAPTVLSEEVVTAPKTNKRGRKVGKPVLAGFELDYSAAMNPATAGLAANYQVTVTTTKRIKRKHVTVRQPIAVRARYDAPRNAVTLTLVGKQLFAQGGQITVIAVPPSGVSSASGDFLAASDTVFTILPKAEGVWPA